MADEDVVDSVELPILPVVGGTRVGAFRVGTTINNLPYIIDGRWNSRDQAWYLDFYEGDLTPIIYGVKVVLGAYLGRRSNHRLFTEGVVVAVDLTNSGQDATFDDFGVRVIVEWIPVLELIRRQKRAVELEAEE